jgi:hypothetical protein
VSPHGGVKDGMKGGLRNGLNLFGSFLGASENGLRESLLLQHFSMAAAGILGVNGAIANENPKKI